jgi:hypothetical protein
MATLFPFALMPPTARVAISRTRTWGWLAQAPALVGLTLVGLVGAAGPFVLPVWLLYYSHTPVGPTLAVIAAIAVGLQLGAFGVAAAWRRRAGAYEPEVRPYKHRVVLDPRWSAVARLLEQLRGPDHHSGRAMLVYDLALGLWEEFEASDRLSAAVSASRALGGSAEFERMDAAQQARLDGLLDQLKSACALALASEASANDALKSIHRDIRAHIDAARELAPYTADRARAAARGRAAARDPG